MLYTNLMGILVAKRATEDFTMQLLVTTSTCCQSGEKKGTNAVALKRGGEASESGDGASPRSLSINSHP